MNDVIMIDQANVAKKAQEKLATQVTDQAKYLERENATRKLIFPSLTRSMR